MITGLQLLSSEGGSFNDILGQISNSSGTLGESFDKMANTSAFKLQSSINELKNSLIDFGGALAPVIDGFSNFVSSFAKGLDALPNGVKTLVGAITGFIAVTSPFASGMAKVIDTVAQLSEIKEIGGLSEMLNLGGLWKGESNADKIAKKTTDSVKESMKAGLEATRDVLTQELTSIENDLSKMSMKGKFGDEAKEIAQQMSGMEAHASELRNRIEETNESIRHLDTMDISNLANSADDVVDGVTDATQGVTNLGNTATQTGGKFSKLWGVMKAHPMASMIGVSVALGVAIWGITKAIQAYDAKLREGRDAVEKYNKSIEEHKANIEELKNSKKAITGLVDEYNTLDKKTNKTKEESERLKQVLEEIAKIDPNLVEYNAEGDPIRLKIQAVEDYIEKIDVATKKEEDFLNNDIRDKAKTSKKAYTEERGDLTKRKDQASLDYDKLIGTNKNTGQQGNKWLKEESETWDEYFTRFNNEFLPEYNRIKDELQTIHDEDLANREKVSNARKDYYNNELKNSKLLKNLSKDEKDTFKNMLDTFDFSEVDDSQVESLFTTMEQGYYQASSKQKEYIDGLITKQGELNNSYNQGTVSAQEYEAQTGRTAVALANLLGISTEQAKQILLSVEYDADKNNETISKLDETKANLISSLEGWQNLDTKQRVPLALEMMLDENTPDQVKKVISEALADGEITDKEYKIICKTVAELNQTDFEADFYNQFDTMKEKIENAGGNTKIEKEIAIEYSTKVENLESLSYFLDNLVGYEKTVEIETKIDEGNIDGLVKTIDKLPQHKQVAVATAIMSSGELKPTELLEFVNGLPKEVRTQAISQIIQSGDMTGDELLDFISGLPESVRSEIAMEVIQKGNMSYEQIMEFLDTLPEEVRTKITADSNIKGILEEKKKLEQPTSSTHTTNSNNSQVDADKNKNKQPTSSTHTNNVNNSQVDSAKNKNKQPTNSTHTNNVNNSKVDSAKNKNKQPTNSNHKINANNSQVESAKRKNQQSTSSTHTINIKQIFTSVGKFFGFGNSGLKQSVGEPKIIELDQPYKINPTNVQSVGEPQVLSGLVNAINNTENVAKISASNIADIMATTKKTTVKPNIDTKSTVTALKYNIDLLNNMSNLLSKLSTQVDTLGAKLQRTWGSNSTKLIKEQISLLTKQQNLTKTNIKNMEGMSKSLKSSLKKQGFKFKDDGSISNYNSKLIAMEKNVEKLKKKEEAYNGKNEKTKNKLAKAYEKANNELQQTKDKLSEYYDLQFNSIPQAKQQWEDYANSIAEARAEIIKADREAKTFFEDMREEIVKARFDRDSTWADTFMLKADLSSWKSAIGYIEKANELLKKNQYEQEILMKNAQSRMKDNKAILDKNGFSFTKGGYLEKAEQNLKKLKKKLSPAEYEAVKEAYDSYVEDMYRTLPEAENQWWQLQQSIEENRKSIEETAQAMKEMVEGANLTQLNAKYDRLSDTLDLLEAKMDLAYGKNKIKYMEEQIDLLQQMSTESEKLANENKILADSYKQQLSSMGVFFDSNGDITNLQSIMASQGTLDDMEELSDLVDKYNDSLSGMREANKSVIENTNSINDLKDSMIELNDEMDELRKNAWATEMENDMKVLENELSKIEAQRELNGASQVELMQKQLSLYEKQRLQSLQNLEYQQKLSKELAKELKTYGFRINDDGTINDTAQQLEMLKNTLSDVEFNHVNDLLEEYFDTALDTIPDLERELIELQKNFEDLEKEKLDITKDIEDKITSIYEKQVEERIKAIEEETDARVKALEKSREEYQKWRDDVDYKNDYDEQLKTVTELQRQIEIAKRDDSLTGQARVSSLMKELQEEQKNLEKLVQDKIDEQINDAYDDQMEKLQENSEAEIKRLEEMWSETNIAKAVQDALKTGIFEDIDGNVTSLKSAMIDMTETSVEYMGVLGDSLKSELLSNLEVALSTMKELQTVTEQIAMPNIDYNSVRYAGVGYDSAKIQGNTTNNNTSNVINVDFNYQITAESGATVDEQAIANALAQSKQEIVSEIQTSILKYAK